VKLSLNVRGKKGDTRLHFVVNGPKCGALSSAGLGGLAKFDRMLAAEPLDFQRALRVLPGCLNCWIVAHLAPALGDLAAPDIDRDIGASGANRALFITPDPGPFSLGELRAMTAAPGASGRRRTAPTIPAAEPGRAVAPALTAATPKLKELQRKRVIQLVDL
jgi:hypothetical protein